MSVAQQADHVIGEELAVEQERRDGFAVLLMEQFAELVEQAGQVGPEPVAHLNTPESGAASRPMNRCGVRTLSQFVARVWARASRRTRVVASSRRSGRSRPLGRKMSSTFRPVSVSESAETVSRAKENPQRRFAVIMSRPRPARKVSSQFPSHFFLDDPPITPDHESGQLPVGETGHGQVLARRDSAGHRVHRGYRANQSR